MDGEKTVANEDVSRARQLVGASMRQVGLAPETGEYDADVIETGTSQRHHERLQTVMGIITEQTGAGASGAPIEVVLAEAASCGIETSTTRETIQKLRN